MGQPNRNINVCNDLFVIMLMHICCKQLTLDLFLHPSNISWTWRHQKIRNEGIPISSSLVLRENTVQG